MPPLPPGHYPRLPPAIPKELHWPMKPLPPGASATWQRAWALEREFYTIFLNVTHECDIGIFGHAEQPSLDDRVRTDGQWKLCKPLTYDGTALSTFQPPCYVVTGGIAGDSTFEDMLSDLGCNVFGYDPTIDVTKIPFKNPDKFKAYRIGFGGKDGVENGYEVKTLQTIMRDHGINTLDVLKMDVEWAEYPTFDAALRQGTLGRIKQIAWEFHFSYLSKNGLPESQAAAAITSFTKYLEYFQKFRENGFVPVDWHQNTGCDVCKELLWVNTKYADEFGLRLKTDFPALGIKKRLVKRS